MDTSGVFLFFAYRNIHKKIIYLLLYLIIIKPVVYEVFISYNII